MAFAITTTASAELAVGQTAPDFTAPATLGGQEFSFSLEDAKSKGPVVVYFYPAAFTKGCTLEAHEFAEAADDFAALGASVIGVSADDIKTLNQFSVEACRNKFPVASDADQAIMKSYDAVMDGRPEVASRTSYVIAPDGKILFVHSDRDYAGHVEQTLAVVKSWKASQ